MCSNTKDQYLVHSHDLEKSGIKVHAQYFDVGADGVAEFHQVGRPHVQIVLTRESFEDFNKLYMAYRAWVKEQA